MESHGYTFRNRDEHDLRLVLSGLIGAPARVAKEAAREHVRRNYSWDKVTDQLRPLPVAVEPVWRENAMIFSSRCFWLY
jgi:hypothetical protein